MTNNEFLRELNKQEKFRKELTTLLNSYSRENDSNTPDYILAEYMLNCYSAFNNAVNARESWYGRKTLPGVLHPSKEKYTGPCDGKCAGDDLGDCSHDR